MRRKDREVTDKNELLDIINQCKVCRIAMRDEEELYIVPMNFGYVYTNDMLTLYFHSAEKGRKISILKAHQDVCIEMDCEHQLVEGHTACAYGYSFRSIIGNGSVVFVKDVEEKKEALTRLMKHQTGDDFLFTDEMAKDVCVFKITVTSFTGKNRPFK